MKEGVRFAGRSGPGSLGERGEGPPQPAESAESAAATAESWALYGRGDFAAGLQAARIGLQRFPAAFDLRYAEGLCLKRLGRDQEAAGAFREALRQIDGLGDKVKAAMLTRLLTGHIHLLEQGAWNLEPETWARA